MPRRGDDACARLLVEGELREHAAGVEAQLELAWRRLHHRAQSLDSAAPHEAFACGVRCVRGQVAKRASELHELLSGASAHGRPPARAAASVAAVATALQQRREPAELRGAQRHRIVG